MRLRQISAARTALLGSSLALATLAGLAGDVLTPRAAHAQKTDTVSLHNGDIFTGEIKEAGFGILKYSTNAASTIYIEWNQIAEITTTKVFQFEFSDGRRDVGSFLPGASPGQARLALEADTVVMPLLQITHVTRLKSNFWDRLDGSVDLGFSFTQDNDKLDFSLSTDLKVNAALNVFRAQFSGSFSRQDSASDIRQYNLPVVYQRQLPRRWFIAGLMNFQSNTQLSLDLRSSLIGGVGNRLAETDRLEFSLWAGLGGSRESFDDEDASTTFDGLVAANFDVFVFGNLDTSITSSLAAVPVLNEWPRVRLQFNGRFRHELVNNLYISFAIAEYFDSRPPSDTEKNSITFNTSVGWSF